MPPIDIKQLQSDLKRAELWENICEKFFSEATVNLYQAQNNPIHDVTYEAMCMRASESSQKLYDEAKTVTRHARKLLEESRRLKSIPAD